MNLITYAPLWLAALTAIALLAGAAEDMIRLRISNVTVLIVLAAAIAAMAFAGFPGALWQNALVFLGILVLGTLAFSRELLGGGDVKLLAATGLWVGFDAAPWLLAAIFLAGGVVAVGYIIVRKMRGRKTPGSKPHSLRSCDCCRGDLRPRHAIFQLRIVSGLCRRSRALTCRNDRGRRAEPPTNAISVASPTRVRPSREPCCSDQRAGNSHCGT